MVTWREIPRISKEFAGTIRSMSSESRELAIAKIRQITQGHCDAAGAKCEIRFHQGYPVTFNHADETDVAAQVAAIVAGDDQVDADYAPTMGGEDFSYMLLERPGAFIFVGNGDTAGLHHPEYDFNDEAIPYGASYWVKLAETQMPAG